MLKPLLVLVISLLLFHPLTFANEAGKAGKADEASKAKHHNTTSSESHGLNVEPDTNDKSVVSEADDDDLIDDKQLFDEEVSGYRDLRDRRFGLLLGIGEASPRHDFHVELIYAPLKILRLSLSYDAIRRKANLKNEATNSVALRARYHLAILPIFFGTIVGGARDSVKGLFQPTADSERVEHDYNYTATSIYGGLSVGAYYFWGFGLYLETTIAGLGLSHMINTQVTSDSDKTESLEEKISEKLIGAKLYGLLNAGLNISIGYMF